jgi:CRP/FNR family transcriptional regulator
MDDFINEEIYKFSYEGIKSVSLELLKKYGKMYKKNQIIIKEDEESDDIYLVYKGSCMVVKKVNEKYRIMNIIHSGEIFGEMAVFDEKIRSATIAAKVDRTVCLKFSKDEFIAIYKIHPRWMDKIIQDMSLRILKMIKKL